MSIKFLYPGCCEQKSSVPGNCRTKVGDGLVSSSCECERLEKPNTIAYPRAPSLPSEFTLTSLLS